MISYFLLKLSPEKLTTILHSFSDNDIPLLVTNNSPQMCKHPYRLLYSCLFISYHFRERLLVLVYILRLLVPYKLVWPPYWHRIGNSSVALFRSATSNWLL